MLRQQAKNEKNIALATGWRCHATSCGANHVSISTGVYSSTETVSASHGMFCDDRRGIELAVADLPVPQFVDREAEATSTRASTIAA